MDTYVCKQQDNISYVNIEWESDLDKQADRSSWCSAGPLQQQDATYSDLPKLLHDADVAVAKMKGINLTLQVWRLPM